MELKKQITEKEALLKLSSLCARAEHCSGEMREKLYRWGFDDDAQQRIIDRLLVGKYIDDERFTRAFVSDKITYNKWGRKKIEQALYQKRVPKDIFNAILDEVPAQRYMEVLRSLLKSKRKSVSGRNEYERSMKLMQYAIGRGFEMQIIRQCIDNAEDLTDDQFSE